MICRLIVRSLYLSHFSHKQKLPLYKNTYTSHVPPKLKLSEYIVQQDDETCHI